MDKEIFIPGTTESVKKNVKDSAMLKEAINAFFEVNYKAMKGFILEYGEKIFFSDLYRYFNYGWWKFPGNKYQTYAGIVISFFSDACIDVNKTDS